MSEVYFTADPDGLDALSQRPSTLEDGMQGLTVAVDAYAPSDLSPSGDVWDALKAFSQAWSDGLKVINGNVSAYSSGWPAPVRSIAAPRRRSVTRRGRTAHRWAGSSHDPAAGHPGDLGHAARSGQRDRPGRRFPAAKRTAGRSRNHAAGADQAGRVGRLDRSGRRRVRPVHRAAAGRAWGVRDGYEGVASALGPSPASSSRWSTPSPPCPSRPKTPKGALAAVQNARSQAIANGQDPATTGWDARLTDATEAVSALRGQQTRLLAELTALAAAGSKKISAAEPKTAGKSLFGLLESDFVRDVADPLANAVEKRFGLAAEAVARIDLGLAADVFKLDEFVAVGVLDVVDALVIDPITGLWDDTDTFLHHMTAENLGRALGDVAGVLGILALIPGVDAFAVPGPGHRERCRGCGGLVGCGSP